MLRFLALRFGRALITISAVLVIAFLTVRLSGTPFEQMYPDGLTEEMEAALNAKYGLDLPLWQQFWNYLREVAQGDFGRSLDNRQKVVEIYASRIGFTLQIGALALVLATAVGIPLGAYAALRRTAPGARAGMSFAFLGYALPHFVIGIGMILLFGYYLRLLPTTGLDSPAHYILPVITLSIPMIASQARFMRAATLDAISYSHVLTAQSMGLKRGPLVRRHILRNAMLPLVTVLGLEVAGLLNGSIFVETVFSLPGVGRVLVGAVKARDFPVLQFGVIAYAAIVVVVNLIVDLLYVVADPRVRLEE
ncbi:ABC transporter permease [Pseudooceanicola sp. 200-1SW]|uniref:ABC transporter permease n=1 Tax=Pseudooceanicola sp. 200-1SW TaxID=3425949 RepID=UPI003D7FD0D3